jgi:UDP-N-acetylglucosamine pyrophosphorylase
MNQITKINTQREHTRAEFLALSKKRAIQSLQQSKMEAAMSFLQSIKSSQGKSFELYPAGHIAVMTCMCTEEFNEKFINDFN